MRTIVDTYIPRSDVLSGDLHSILRTIWRRCSSPC